MDEITIWTGTWSVTAKDFLWNNPEWVDKVVDAVASIFGLGLSVLLSAWNLALLFLTTFQEYIVVVIIVSAIYYKFTWKIPFAGGWKKKI